MKPNVIFIVVDCLRSDVLHSDDRTTVTPNIDRLRKKSTFFKNTISVSTSTLPCFGSIVTGIYPFNHGLRDLMHLKIKEDAKTIGELFKENGYNTYASVTGSLFLAHGFSRGFDEYEHRELWDNLHSDWYEKLLDKFRDGYFKEPFLFFFHIWDLHQPRFVDSDLDKPKYGRTLYERSVSSIDRKLGELLDLNKDAVIVLTGDHGEKITSGFFEESMDRAKCFYYPHIRWSHKKYHRKFSKMFRGTLNMLQGSESEFGATHGYHLYRSLITTPLIVKGLSKPDREVERLIRHIDIVPSLCDGLFDSQEKFDGKSVFNEDDELPKDAYSEIFLGNELKEENWLVSLVTNRYQYVFKPRGGYEKLYDIEDGEIDDMDIKRELRRRAEQLNPEILYGCSFESKVGLDREIIENKLRSVGYLD